MLQRLAVTNPKNDKMDPHGVNPTLSIFLPTPFPVAMQGLGATAPWEKDLRIPCLEIIVFTNWKTGIGLSKECYQKWYARLSCLEFIVLTKWKTGIGLSKSVLSKKKHKILEDYSSYIKIKIRMLKGLSIGRFQLWQKVRKIKIAIWFIWFFILSFRWQECRWDEEIPSRWPSDWCNEEQEYSILYDGAWYFHLALLVCLIPQAYLTRFCKMT